MRLEKLAGISLANFGAMFQAEVLLVDVECGSGVLQGGEEVE